MISDQKYAVRLVNGCLFVDDASGCVILQQNARPGLRPYIHPLRGPGGTTCLTEDSPWHHPWQHGLQTGFHGVNGCDFWFDLGQRTGLAIGTIEPCGLQVLGSEPPTWSVEARWCHSGVEILSERQRWSLCATGSDLLYLDLEWRIEAVVATEIEQAIYGGLFVRMPYHEDRGAVVRNSNGLEGDGTEQQPAAWVDLFMPVDDGTRHGGITIFDHPGNPDHPAHWRVDGQRGINPAPNIPGPIELAAGESAQYRYRLLLRDGDLPAARLHEEFQLFSGLP